MVQSSEQVQYYAALGVIEKTANKFKVELNIGCERSSDALRGTGNYGNNRALALADAYQGMAAAQSSVPATGIADVGKPFRPHRYRSDGMTPELCKNSIPISYTLMQPVDGKDIGTCKGLKVDHVSSRLIGDDGLRMLCCSAPSAVTTALAIAAVAVDTGHLCISR